MAAFTRFAVSGLTGRVLLMTCETVVNDTFARRATSLMVTTGLGSGRYRPTRDFSQRSKATANTRMRPMTMLCV